MGEVLAVAPHDPFPQSNAEATLTTLMRRGQELADVPRSQVDLRWHAEAFLIGDLPAVAVALIRSDQT